jgi:hypothetical protein
VITGAFPYALGLACALLALRALRPLRPWPFAACALLAFAASPLAFVLLVIVLVAIAAAGDSRVHRLRVPIVAVAAIGCLGGLLWRLFPDDGRFPFSGAELAATLVFCGLGIAFTVRVPASRVLLRFFVLYAAVAIGAFLVPSAVGENIARLRFVALPLAVLALALRRWRPVVPACVALLLAASWNVTPLAFSLAHSTEDPSAAQTYWAPVVSYLEAHLQPSYRVEAVDTAGHWEAVYLPQASIPIVRGWFRQDDFPQNAVLYRRLGAAAYRAWLRRMGAAYVVLTDAPVDYSSRGEAALLRSGRSGLEPVFSTRHVSVYRVPDPHGIVSGARGARVVKLAPAGMTLALPRAGTYRIAVRYSPYWHTTSGCVTPRKDGMTSLVVTQRGWVRFTFDVTPKRVVEAGVGAKPHCGHRADDDQRG